MNIYSGTSNRPLAEKICNILTENLPGFVNKLDNLIIEKFSDGEILPRFVNESIRGKEIFFIQTTTTHDAIWELLLVIDAAKRAECSKFTLIAPDMGYSRQDKNDHLRSSIGARVMADTLVNAGVNRVITIDLHAKQIQGFYPNTVPVVHLNGNKIFTRYIKSLRLKDMCFTAPDLGASHRNRDAAKPFGDEVYLAIIDKRRVKPNEIESMRLIGKEEVAGRNVILVDDLADTLGTLCKAAKLCMDNGALSVRGFATHAVLSGKAMENLDNSVLTEFVVSDTIDTSHLSSSKLRVITSADLIADILIALNKGTSISEINEMHLIKED